MDPAKGGDKWLILTPSEEDSDFSSDAITAYTGVETNGKARRTSRSAFVSSRSGTAASTVAEIGDCELSLPAALSVDKRAIAVQGGGSWEGPWEAGAYSENDVVSAGGKYYRASDDITDEEPGEDEEWVLAPSLEVVATNCIDAGRKRTICQCKDI